VRAAQRRHAWTVRREEDGRDDEHDGLDRDGDEEPQSAANACGRC
jgi:hypothetical protein